MLNLSSSPFGDGWTLQGLEQITSATGGVILSQGGGSTSLWFSGSPGVGGNYTSPAGEFSTLTKTSTGYTRTLTDGTQITFNSSGYETATIDLNGLHTTYSYNGYNQLTSVKDPYAGRHDIHLRLQRRRAPDDRGSRHAADDLDVHRRRPDRRETGGRLAHRPTPTIPAIG